MGGFFGVAAKENCVFDLFFGTDYHSHLGTRRGGLVVYGKDGFNRAIHNIENSPFRTKFDKEVQEMDGYMGLDYEKRKPVIILFSPDFNYTFNTNYNEHYAFNQEVFIKYKNSLGPEL